MASQPQVSSWLTEHGPKELELLFRAIVVHPSTPILLTDDERRYRDASVGASKLLGVPREKIIGRRLDDFAAPDVKPEISDRWRAFLETGEQEGTLKLVGPDGGPREVEYIAKGNVLPVRHLLVLHDKANIPTWVQDYGLLLMDSDGRVATWYSGAERIYGYKSAEVMGKTLSIFYPDEDTLGARLGDELKKAASEGHAATECW